jgi:[ribosomal protein S5]-alanine N-acetyltransferase
MRDERDVFEIMSDAETLRYLDWETLDDEDVRQWLERDARIRHLEADRYFHFGVELPATEKLIGLVSFLYRGQESRDAGFNAVVNRNLRRQGYGAEIVRGVLEFAFRELNLQRVAAGCDSRNVSGIKMLQKARMRGEGEWLEAERIRDEWVNTVWFAKLRREYEGPK